MARSAEDCALLLSAMCGPDLDRDSTSLDVPVENFSSDLLRPLAKAGKDGGPIRVGVPSSWLAIEQGLPTGEVDGCSFEIRDAIRDALHTLEEQGAIVISIDLPNTALSIPVYYIIAPAEASSNLSRFDGVKFGHRTKDYTDLVSMYKKSRAEGFGEEVKRRIMTGAYVLSHGYYDAYYLQAQKIRRMIADDFQRAFAECDVIAGPVAPTVAWKLGNNASDPLADYLADIFTLPASLAGLPCMSVPVGMGESNMPVGMQLIGNYLQEAKLLNVAHQFQLNTDFHNAKPEGV
jgi:aspartyl-tRNA(Asn)/glutamyl-tRNA(Gln) amidotransferase subunit A